MIKKLRRKFVLINMSIVTVILAAVFLGLLSMTRAGAIDDSMLVLRRAASNENAVNALSENAMSVQIPFFAVDVDTAGHIVILNGSYYDMADYEAIQSIVAASVRQNEEVGILDEFNLRYYRQTTPFGVRIAYADTSFEQSVTSRFTRSAMIIGGATLLLFFGISVLLARWAVKPVAETWNRQKNFIEDASHELKTPLSVVMSSADMLIGHPDERGERAVQWTQNIKAEAVRMRALVEDMLSLARVENTSAPVQMETVNLSALVTDSALQLEATAYENGKSLEYDIIDGVCVCGSKPQLQQLIDNLLTNAIRYSSEKAKIRVALTRHNKKVLFVVENDGEPIPKDRLSHLFERFYRLDGARSSGGCGLGLAIAKGVVERHHGKIWAESENGVNRFVCELPGLPLNACYTFETSDINENNH